MLLDRVSTGTVEVLTHAVEQAAPGRALHGLPAVALRGGENLGEAFAILPEVGDANLAVVSWR
ncbi:MAG: hypothetical protein IT452_16295 [Planctomycetia bacterium]|nr:hypothetical protein [Planctomycetia bacterium]